MNSKLRPFLSRKNFVFLLWEIERVLIRNMKHYGIMTLLNLSKFVLNFICFRAVVVILFSILCPRISYHLLHRKFTYTKTLTTKDLLIYLFIKLMDSILISTCHHIEVVLNPESNRHHLNF